MDGDLQRPLGDAQVGGQRSVGRKFISRQRGPKGLKLTGAPRGGVVLCDVPKPPVDNVQGPLTIEAGVVPTEDSARGQEFAGIGSLRRHTAAAFESGVPFAKVGFEVPERAQEVRAEAAAGRIGGVEAATGKNVGEKRLGPFTRHIVAASSAAEHAEHRLPVGFTELG